MCEISYGEGRTDFAKLHHGLGDILSESQNKTIKKLETALRLVSPASSSIPKSLLPVLLSGFDSSLWFSWQTKTETNSDHYKNNFLTTIKQIIRSAVVPTKENFDKVNFVYSFFSIKIREGKYLALESCELLLAGQKPFRCLTYPSLSSDFVLFNSRLRFAFSLSSLEISPSSSRTVSWNTISQAKINDITTDIYILPSFIHRQDKISLLYLTRCDEKTTAIFASDGLRVSWLLTVLGKVFSPQPNNFIFPKPFVA